MTNDWAMRMPFRMARFASTLSRNAIGAGRASDALCFDLSKLRLDEVSRRRVGPGKLAQRDPGLVGEELVDRPRLARPVVDRVLVEKQHAASRDTGPDSVKRCLGRPVKVAVEVHQREPHPWVLRHELRHRLLDVAVDQPNARFPGHKAIGVEDRDGALQLVAKVRWIEAALDRVRRRARLSVYRRKAAEASPVVEAEHDLGAVADGVSLEQVRPRE